MLKISLLAEHGKAETILIFSLVALQILSSRVVGTSSTCKELLIRILVLASLARTRVRCSNRHMYSLRYYEVIASILLYKVDLATISSYLLLLLVLLLKPLIVVDRYSDGV